MDISPKRKQRSHKEMCNVTGHWGHARRTHGDSTTHWSTLLKWKQGTVSKPGEGEEQLGHSLLVAIKYNTAFLENNWAVSYKLNHVLTTCANNSTRGYLSREIKIMFTWKSVHNTYDNFMCSSHRVEAPQVSFARGVDHSSGTATVWNRTQQEQGMCSWYK